MGVGLEARNVLNFATLAVAGSAVGLASASPVIYYRVKRAVFTVEDASVRYREDGTAPTSTEGHLLVAGDVLKYKDANYETTLNKIQFIRATNTSAALKITYYD